MFRPHCLRCFVSINWEFSNCGIHDPIFRSLKPYVPHYIIAFLGSHPLFLNMCGGYGLPNMFPVFPILVDYPSYPFIS